MPIDRFDELPKLLEQYMEEKGGDDRWVPCRNSGIILT
jgi:hypothetical protein